MKLDNEIEKLFSKIRTLLGAPIRIIHLDDNQLCDLLEISVEDYSSIIQNWLIGNNWITMNGQNISNLDFTFAFTMRSLNMLQDYSQWFSKEVGLQQTGKYELKKDFFTIEMGKQSYVIPAGREINKVLWMNPPTITPALFANLGGMTGGLSMGASLGMGGSMLGMGGFSNTMGGYYVMPAYDTMLLATDMNFKQRMLRSDMVYEVTALNSGEHIIHLKSTPGSNFSFASSGLNNNTIGISGCEVWYTYYDTTQGNVDECRRLNSDIILTPDQVPIEGQNYSLFNDAAKTTIRQLLLANAKITLGNIRGTYSGKVSIMDADLNMDYRMLLDQGKDEKEKVERDLKERLEKLTPWAQMKNQADMVDDMMRIKKHTPYQTPILVI